MKTYTEAAQTAHDSLIPLVDSAIASAKDRLSKATASADHDAIAPCWRLPTTPCAGTMHQRIIVKQLNIRST